MLQIKTKPASWKFMAAILIASIIVLSIFSTFVYFLFNVLIKQ
jgi:hypothetical protein